MNAILNLGDEGMRGDCRPVPEVPQLHHEVTAKVPEVRSLAPRALRKDSGLRALDLAAPGIVPANRCNVERPLRIVRLYRRSLW